jgi:hypothetical protein
VEFELNSVQPQRAAPPLQPLWCQEPWGFTFEIAAGLEQRQHLGYQGVSQGALCHGRHVLRQAFWLPGYAVAQAADNAEPLWQGVRRPGWLRLTGNL